MECTAKSALGIGIFKGEAVAGFDAESFEAELHDLAGCVQGLCSADFGAMATPAGVTGNTPLGTMFAWEEGRLSRAAKWRAEAGSDKALVAKVAKRFWPCGRSVKLHGSQIWVHVLAFFPLRQF